MERKQDRVYGRLSGQEFQRLLAKFRYARTNQQELKKLFRGGDKKLAALLEEHGSYWWVFYDLEYSQHLALWVILMGWTEALANCAKQENPTRAFLEFASLDDESGANPLQNMPAAQQAAFFNITIGIFHSIEALGYFGKSINELLKMASEGNESALLDAAAIDRCALCTCTGMAIIADAQLRSDKRFFAALFKRVKDPHKGRRQYMDLRFIHAALQDTGAITTCSADDLLDLVGDKLGLYSTKSGDPVKGLRELFRAWKK